MSEFLVGVALLVFYIGRWWWWSWLVSGLRRARLLPRPPVSRAQAVAIAQAECDRRGWGWDERVWLLEGLFSYSIISGSPRSSHVEMVINAWTGRVTRVHLHPL